MTTKAIIEVLALFKSEASFPESPRARKADEALAEVEALERGGEDPYTAMVREFHQRMGLVVRDAPILGTPEEALALDATLAAYNVGGDR